MKISINQDDSKRLTGLLNVHECVAFMIANGQTDCELAFDLDGEKVNVMVSITQPSKSETSTLTDSYIKFLAHEHDVAMLYPEEDFLMCSSGIKDDEILSFARAIESASLPNEKLVNELVTAMKKIRNASDDLSIWYGAIDGREELNTAMDEVDSILAAVGAKEA